MRATRSNLRPSCRFVPILAMTADKTSSLINPIPVLISFPQLRHSQVAKINQTGYSIVTILSRCPSMLHICESSVSCLHKLLPYHGRLIPSIKHRSPHTNRHLPLHPLPYHLYPAYLFSAPQILNLPLHYLPQNLRPPLRYLRRDSLTAPSRSLDLDRLRGFRPSDALLLSQMRRKRSEFRG